MAKILKTLSPVDSISGMIGKRKETVSDKAFIVNVKRVGGVKHKGAPFMYFSLRVNDRSTQPSTAELLNRQKFKAAVEGTRERMINPEYVQIDHAEFNKQTKYPTLYGYVFSVVYASLD